MDTRSDAFTLERGGSPRSSVGTSLSREAAALLACDVEEPQEPSSKDINYDKFFKDLDELREVRTLYDAVEDAACPKRLPHDFRWWPQDDRG